MANSFINKKVDLTTTNLTTLYTVPAAKTAVVKSILVSDDSGSGTTITVTLVDSSSNIFSLFKTKTISGNANTAKRGNNLMELKQAKVETTYRHKETGELFKERKDWEAKGYKQEDMAQDVKVIMPSLDLFTKTK